MRITWTGPVKLTGSEYYLGHLGRLEVARLDSNLSRDTWKLKLRVPGYTTDAPGGVRYSTPEAGYQAAEEILGRWMKDVGMRWEPECGQVRVQTRVGIQYDGLTKGEVRVMVNEDTALSTLLRDTSGLYTNGKVVRQRIEEIYHDWEPVV